MALWSIEICSETFIVHLSAQFGKHIDLRKKEARLTIVLEPGQGKKEEVFKELELPVAISVVVAAAASAIVAAARPGRFASRARTRARRFASGTGPNRGSTLLARHRTLSHDRRADSHRFGRGVALLAAFRTAEAAPIVTRSGWRRTAIEPAKVIVRISRRLRFRPGLLSPRVAVNRAPGSPKLLHPRCGRASAPACGVRGAPVDGSPKRRQLPLGCWLPPTAPCAGCTRDCSKLRRCCSKGTRSTCVGWRRLTNRSLAEVRDAVPLRTSRSDSRRLSRPGVTGS